MQAVTVTRIRPVDVDVDERPEPPVLVEQQIGDRELAQSALNRPRLRLEALAAAGLARQQRGEEDDRYGSSPASTERTGGRWDASSTQPSPVEPKTEPLCVPRYTPAGSSRS